MPLRDFGNAVIFPIRCVGGGQVSLGLHQLPPPPPPKPPPLKPPPPMPLEPEPRGRDCNVSPVARRERPTSETKRRGRKLPPLREWYHDGGSV